MSTKKPLTPDQAGACRTLADCLEWRAALEMKQRLDAELQTIKAEAARHDGHLEPTPREGRIARFAAVLVARVAGAPLPVFAEDDGPTPSEKLAAVRGEIEKHTVKMDRLRRELAGVLYPNGWEQQHLEARRRIARGIIELKTVIDEEQRLAGEMFAAGALVDPTFGHRLWINTSGCGPLPNLFRTLDLRGFRETNRNLLVD